ncbi:MAG: nuclear transport factor 2 family protein [Pseudomonadota bacterium]
MSQDNVGVVKHMYASFHRGDIDAVLATFSDDIDWLQSGPPDTFPFAGPFHGRNGMLDYFKGLKEALDIQEFVEVEFIGHEDRVIVFGTEKGVVKPTGGAYRYDWTHVFTMRDGKVVKYRDYYDTAAVLRAYQKA